MRLAHCFLFSLAAAAPLFYQAPTTEPWAPEQLPTVEAPALPHRLVNWHASYDEALAAAKVSGKPVLLFQLLGDLDDAMC